MKTSTRTTAVFLLAVVALITSTSVAFAQEKKTLKEALKGKFLIGTAVNTRQASGQDKAGVRVIQEQFNAIVAENCMKSQEMHPEENRYNFTQADEFVAFGEKNGMVITGHTLIWHSQLSPWFCVDGEGKNVSPEVLKKRMKDHITTIVKRYKGRIIGWDVVNEAIEDDGSYRKSKFYEILGEEYIPLAFQYAHEADPNAELYYNDFSMANPGKRAGVVKLVKALKKRGIRIDAVGMQGHIGMDYPQVGEFEKSMLAFAEAGVKVMVTELDLTVLPTPKQNIGAEVSASFEYKKDMNPYPNGLPEDVSKAWTERMNDFFRLFLKHQDIITRVTLWGVTDLDTWRNDWPMRGRTDYPLLFDRSYQPKPVVSLIINEAMQK
ncbi:MULTISPECIES: endo-1,4-beta-xylanase [Bacteroides]|uniref:endo-1,4-beta-xylanase n=1 Tax=Bacteroides TaxID=816 RepID=UPI00189B2960|nr:MULTISPECIES: endo-1,4-beta-xylanase [Bacteroides]